MHKRLILILALAFVVGVTMAAYAEVQNVKVSGDLTVKGVARNNFDLVKSQKYGLNGSPTRVVKVFPPEGKAESEMWRGSGDELAEKLFAKLIEGKFV